jgi:hypothetical protein
MNPDISILFLTTAEFVRCKRETLLSIILSRPTNTRQLNVLKPLFNKTLNRVGPRVLSDSTALVAQFASFNKR